MIMEMEKYRYAPEEYTVFWTHTIERSKVYVWKEHMDRRVHRDVSLRNH